MRIQKNSLNWSAATINNPAGVRRPLGLVALAT